MGTITETNTRTKGRKSAMAEIEAATAAADLNVDMAEWVALAEIAVNPFMANASVLEAFARGPTQKVKLAAMIFALSSQYRDIQDGDIRVPEAMLYAQSVALQGIFVHLCRRATGLDNVPHFHPDILALAFKAQAQSRAALEALGELMHPKSATFVQQANIASQQLVQNQRPARADAGKISTPANGLLKEADHATVDSCRTGEASAADLLLETVGKIDRPPNQRRQVA